VSGGILTAGLAAAGKKTGLPFVQSLIRCQPSHESPRAAAGDTGKSYRLLTDVIQFHRHKVSSPFCARYDRFFGQTGQDKQRFRPIFVSDSI